MKRKETLNGLGTRPMGTTVVAMQLPINANANSSRDTGNTVRLEKKCTMQKWC